MQRIAAPIANPGQGKLEAFPFTCHSNALDPPPNLIVDRSIDLISNLKPSTCVVECAV